MGDLFSGPKIKAPPAPKSKALKEATQAAKNLSPVGFNAGGLSGRFANGQITVGSSPGRQGLVDSLASRFAEQAGRVSELRSRVAPGVSELRRVRLQEIVNARNRAVGNLRDNLARRRVLGSSFGEDALTRAELEFGQAAERTAAETELMEIDLTNQFLSEEFDLRRQSVATNINELNIQADLASSLVAEANDVLATGAQLQAQLAVADANFRANIFSTQSQTAINQAELDVKAQAGAGALIGKVAGTVLGPAGTALGERFSTSLGLG